LYVHRSINIIWLPHYQKTSVLFITDGSHKLKLDKTYTMSKNVKIR
jgi:hypothetical protein